MFFMWTFWLFQVQLPKQTHNIKNLSKGLYIPLKIPHMSKIPNSIEKTPKNNAQKKYMHKATILVHKSIC